MDIGGGLSANYDTDEFSPTYAQFAALLQKVTGMHKDHDDCPKQGDIARRDVEQEECLK